MMILIPFLMAVVPGIVILLITWWFKKQEFSLFVRSTPGILSIISAMVLFYIGFVGIRGFEGAAYGFVAFFLVLFSIASFIMAKRNSAAR